MAEGAPSEERGQSRRRRAPRRMPPLLIAGLVWALTVLIRFLGWAGRLIDTDVPHLPLGHIQAVGTTILATLLNGLLAAPGAFLPLFLYLVL